MTIRTDSKNSIHSNRIIEDESDSDIESVKETKRRRRPFQKIGITFLGVAIIFSLLLVTVPAALLNHVNTFVDGVLFRALFAAFVACLFICLCSIYYLGGENQAWEDPEGNDLNLSFQNITVILGIVIEFVQLFSFSFNQLSPFLGSEELRNLNYLAIPYEPGKVFRVIGESYTSNFIARNEQRYYSILWFLVNTMYLPVMSTMFGGVDCTFQSDNNIVSWDSDPSLTCLRGIHIVFIVCSMVALVVYYPAASFAQSQTQNISDIKFKPTVVFIFAQGKVLLAAMAVFATSYIYVYLAAVIVVNIVFLGINVILEPCIVEWVNRMRTVFFSFCCISTICSWLALIPNIKDFVPMILMIFGWVAFAVVYSMLYYFEINLGISEKIFSLIRVKETPRKPPPELNKSSSHINQNL
ncbi:hypothetical protein PPL_12502 [Heterostelium album PN500]|uniref:Transmembrane protein n=1 Tax=Heterostelium pallidum (strain ATCC 26659 / Pp 5 / PN500) TaxID=670386 RepID=D3BMS9_HETP5|nr:hypothetical protein PPL_12502 [Heterostelium album PN500]EFA77291.1 hypothetical protein PPL_12502 [Heterostelium album PN500]|eukprot:XP_020429420.1 hypothetical protein PPL_12502 [Heterostelium album PN500]